MFLADCIYTVVIHILFFNWI